MADLDIRMQAARVRVEERRKFGLLVHNKRKCANPECLNSFSFKSVKAKYCSAKCRYRVKNLLREVMPERKKKQLKYNREYCRRLRRSKKYADLKLDPHFKRLKKLRKWKHKYKVDVSNITPKPDKCENPHCSNTRLHFDHDHATNKFRGWLCYLCNPALGMARDNPAILRWLAEYLEQRSG